MVVIINLSEFLKSLSQALDYVENEVVQINADHAKRVAILVNRMAKVYDYDEDTVFALTQAALLHDCALMDYVKDEKSESVSMDERSMANHCIAGEKFVQTLPFHELAEGAVLFHHECADGTGALKRHGNEVPMTAQIIHIADTVDVRFGLSDIDSDKFHQIVKWIGEERNHLFTEQCVDLWIQSIDYDYMKKCSGENCNKTYDELNSIKEMDVPVSVLRNMAGLFAQITDYKSNFTWRHSLGIAEKAEIMGKYYGLDEDTCSCLYIAGALHDIGKLMIPENILEKPGKLTKEEYSEIQNHAVGTYCMLKNIRGMEDITRWAALHHEKLDGSGYPFGFKGDQLGKMERLMACLDIYQALCEERPYKKGFSHGKAIDILKEMGENNQLDIQIIKDIDDCMGGSKPIDNDSSQINPGDNNAEHLQEGKEFWSCPVCGYIYEGDLPKEFICPRCEQPGTVFVKTSCFRGGYGIISSLTL